jgi:hypothetical protein
MIKKVENLEESDLKSNRVWQYVNSDHIGETAVKPIKRYPVKSTKGKLFAVEISLNNGNKCWTLIGNIDTTAPMLTEHFLTVSFLRKNKWFHLARYHDYDFEVNGPSQLADFLGLRVEEIFPLNFDLTPYAKGDSTALVGVIHKEPKERLTRDDIIALAVTKKQK